MFLASLISSWEQNKGDDTDDLSKCNENAGMGESSRWEVAPKPIISAVTSKTHDVNLTDPGAKILTSGPP